jgi:hypothetical protein
MEACNASAAGTLTLGGDLTVNRLGFGAMRITGAGVWGEPKDAGEVMRVLRRAVELGVNFIDTADSYGPDVSERLIAAALHPYPAGLVIATKAGLVRPGPGQWAVNCHPQHLREACEGSLRRLKLARIELYQLHRADPKVPLEDSLGELRRLQEEGKIRHVGVSNFSVRELKRASDGAHCRRPRCKCQCAHDCMAAGEVAGHAADSWHLLDGAPRGERGGSGAPAECSRNWGARLSCAARRPGRRAAARLAGPGVPAVQPRAERALDRAARRSL